MRLHQARIDEGDPAPSPARGPANGLPKMQHKLPSSSGKLDAAINEGERR